MTSRLLKQVSYLKIRLSTRSSLDVCSEQGQERVNNRSMLTEERRSSPIEMMLELKIDSPGSRRKPDWYNDLVERNFVDLWHVLADELVTEGLSDSVTGRVPSI